MKKNLLSIAVCSVFILLGIASNSINKMHYKSFNYENHIEDRDVKENFLVKNDGSKIMGTDIHYNGGVFSKSLIKIDGNEYKIDDVIGYQKEGVYFARLNSNTYLQRILKGKINVYVNLFEETTDGGRPRMVAFHYYQVGDKGELTKLANEKDLQAALGDSQTALDMVT